MALLDEGERKAWEEELFPRMDLNIDHKNVDPNRSETRVFWPGDVICAPVWLYVLLQRRRLRKGACTCLRIEHSVLQ